VDGISPLRTTWWKGAIAGTTNLALALCLGGASWPGSRVVVALAVGAVCYGVSIALYVTAAHDAGATRTQAVFAAAPFIGAALSWLVLGEAPGRSWLLGAGLLVPSVVLLVFDRHEHFHVHDAVAHVHSHRHDDGHHAHEHPGQPASVRHAHWHEHERLGHRHAHGSDLHHRHGR
jgi:drug/metabolite transporter (DMT)-like permease